MPSKAKHNVSNIDPRDASTPLNVNPVSLLSCKNINLRLFMENSPKIRLVCVHSQREHQPSMHRQVVLAWAWLDIHLFDKTKTFCFGLLRGRGCVESKTSAERISTITHSNAELMSSFHKTRLKPLIHLLSHLVSFPIVLV